MNMNRRSPFSRPLRDPKNRIGATAVEYMIMLILVALFVMGIIRVFGNAISEKVSHANSGIETMADRPSGSGEGVGGEASGSASGGSGSKGGSSESKSGSGKSGDKSGKGSGSAQGSASKSGEGSKKGGVNLGGKGSKNGSAKTGSNKKGKRIKGSASRSEKEEMEDDSGAGINPLVLLIALVLVGLLIYVMVGKKT